MSVFFAMDSGQIFQTWWNSLLYLGITPHARTCLEICLETFGYVSEYVPEYVLGIPWSSPSLPPRKNRPCGPEAVVYSMQRDEAPTPADLNIDQPEEVR